jgi:hypothetical protein
VIDVEQAGRYALDHDPRRQDHTMTPRHPTARAVVRVRQRAQAAQAKADEAARDLAHIERAQTESRVKKIAAVLVRMGDRLTDADKQRIRRAIGDADSVRVNAPRYRRPGTQDKWSGSTHGARAQAAQRQFDVWNKSAEGKAWWRSPQGRAQKLAEPDEVYPMIAFVRLSDSEAEQIIEREQAGDV